MLARFIRTDSLLRYWKCPTELTLNVDISWLLKVLAESEIGYADYTFDKGPTALYFACLFGHRFVAEILLLTGANKATAIAWAQKIPDPKWKAALKRESTSLTILNLRPRPQALFALLEWCIQKDRKNLFEYLCSKIKTETNDGLDERKESEEKISISELQIKQLIQLAVNQDRSEMEKKLQKFLPAKYICVKENRVQMYYSKNLELAEALKAGDLLMLMRIFLLSTYRITESSSSFYTRTPEYFDLLINHLWSREGFLSQVLELDSRNRNYFPIAAQLSKLMQEFGRSTINEMRQYFYERRYGRNNLTWQPIPLPNSLQSFFVSQGIKSPRLTRDFCLNLRGIVIPNEIAVNHLFGFFNRKDLAKIARTNWAFYHHQQAYKDLLYGNQLHNSKILRINRKLTAINNFLAKENEVAKSWSISPLVINTPAGFLELLLFFYILSSLLKLEIPWKALAIFLLIGLVSLRSDRFHPLPLNAQPALLDAANIVVAECPQIHVRGVLLGKFLQQISQLKINLETEIKELQEVQVAEAKETPALQRR